MVRLAASWRVAPANAQGVRQLRFAGGCISLQPKSRNSRRIAHQRCVKVLAYGTSIDEDEDTYYGILGISPLASQQEVKKAYYKVMREFHPDISNDVDGDTTEFCIFLNEVYETLSDPERRAAYDEIAGIAATGVNPFMDTSYERDKAFVDEYTCIGCRNCSCVASSTFAIEEDFGRARVMQQDADSVAKIQEAIDTCPVNCIHWVTAPQLTLLENEMRRMERASAWVLMNGGGSATNVFQEASITWEKRRSLARDKAYAQQMSQRRNGDESGSSPATVGVSWFAKMWQPAATAASYSTANDTDEADDWSQGGRPTEEVRRKTASSVASAARKWRDLKRKQRQKGEDAEVRLLSASVGSD